MEDQALLEGIVVFSDEDGPGRQRDTLVRQALHERLTQYH